jgi:hypothetical protein
MSNDIWTSSPLLLGKRFIDPELLEVPLARPKIGAFVRQVRVTHGSRQQREGMFFLSSACQMIYGHLHRYYYEKVYRPRATRATVDATKSGALLVHSG